jgi:tol-pal system protein YbgF
MGLGARQIVALGWKGAVLFAVTLALVAVAAPAKAERRVALVIGNSAYESMGMLPNPLNDAQDIAAALGGMGFNVTLGKDVDEDQFAELLDNFTSIAQGADVALVYYAGHGIQFQNENFLVPVDARLKTRLSLKRETLSLSDISDAVRGAVTSLIFIDACRSFPLEGTFFTSAVERITPVRGLAPIEPSPNSFIAFSASAGQTAADGFTRNSPFASALLEFLPRPGLEIAGVFTLVASQVRDTTGGAQIPQSWANLSIPLMLVAPRDDAVASTTGGPSEEERLYLMAREVGTTSAYRSFIARFPGGFFAELAKEELEERQASEQALANVASNGISLDDQQTLEDGDARAQYVAGYNAIVRGDYAFAEKQFRQFVATYPLDPQAPDAANWLGEALLQRQAYADAADTMLTAFQAYERSARAPDLLLRLGIALVGAGEVKTACRTYSEVAKRYPNTPEAFTERLKEERQRAKCPA